MTRLERVLVASLVLALALALLGGLAARRELQVPRDHPARLVGGPCR